MIELSGYTSSRRGMDLTPLIDVVFLLLIFFLLTAVFVKPSIPLDLPKSETAKVIDKPEVSVTIKKDGSIMLNDDDILLPELYAALSKIYRDLLRDRDISLMADKEVPFGRVIEVMDIAKRAGVENISVLTERKRADGEEL
ncbi:biopolymer transporter ExbD [Thermodesulfovibrionales bacterium]|nr:biopolymer transporter ExbD [Thermodesulfovibrionales bacterium]MCL0047292.1 biopolymer transporter ExbD [Thermodesulfovibrionales bacterium]MCL0085855.1 biopolymer transporter ExbD [Thermodesulfovibrionales bacterium]MCL0107187.1 biopolymer transporter ExbD [Thermodesulfovibrionales bacterium]